MPLPVVLLMMLVLLSPWSAQAAKPSEGLFDLDALEVKIAPDRPYIELLQGEEKVLLMRHQDPGHTIRPPFEKTSRPCPPYCVQPMQLAPGVETIGELELIDYLQRAAGELSDVLVIDSRTPDWFARGTIPGALNIPYTQLDPAHAKPAQIAELLQLEFGAVAVDGLWDFDHVKTLVFFCNGAWCGQSPTNIKALLGFGFPAHKLKWYRGGMQAWEQLGLTTVSQVPDAD
ncbi:rhodanese-like domain-containing protein [Lamprobacter modestohalophilus]|uniref:rhodanese-like domain-containing protein n=1 Tax=Lamprobacter modestohalophilus TaxID=1064514 RepID=UPI002ADEEC5E|nr:rhodanese-like domain-containing protein [Lamprobacter modestohalophilus]MEA1050357.1 rhodanese-like domain-containing protein [Lamprobacter modestohalophilus]